MNKQTNRKTEIFRNRIISNIFVNDYDSWPLKLDDFNYCTLMPTLI